MGAPGPAERRPFAGDGLVLVDKPAGLTSHDVVARVRRLAGTRKVGHAGTLDPMATGVLVVGVGRATRLLGHLAAGHKTYTATVRFGLTTTTDDAEGEPLVRRDASGVTDDAIASAVAAHTGDLMQVPAAVSALKVDGVRAYARARAGEQVELAARPVTVSAFEVLARRGDDVDVRVECSTGTYVRALARDVGAALGVGAHLVALRRTASGHVSLDRCRTLEQHAEQLELVPLPVAVAEAFGRRELDDDEARRLRHGQPLKAVDLPGPVGAFAPDGSVVALVAEREGLARVLVGFTG